MSTSVSRRGFIAGSAIAAGLAGLAGCSSTGTETTDTVDAASYPIDPDGDDVEAKWTSEETRDGWTKVTNPDDGAELGVMDASKIIQVDGLAFKDMNGNGKLDLYEDWRQDKDARAAALAEMLSAEDIFPLLWAGGTTAGFGDTDVNATEYVDEGSRAGVSRLEANAESFASAVEWINMIQGVCEESAYGIPYLNYSDPYSVFGMPSGVGITACMDKDLWHKAGMWQARAWRASGVRCELGPQIDIYTNPIGVRLADSLSEDPAVNRDFCQEFAGGMQSTWADDEGTDDQGWGKDSCAVMLKHFVGEGAPEGGRNDHVDQGKWNVFPGSNFNAHLIPFLDGGMNLNSKTEQMAAIMPCYGVAYDPNNDDLGDHVGSAYSRHNMSILRNAGWDGMICTDWTVLSAQVYGVGDKSKAERYGIFMKNSISQHGGSFEPDVAEETYNLLVDELGEDAALALYRENARRMLRLMMNVDLFDQPYSERANAKAVFENETAQAFGKDLADKCVVMLKNSDGIIADGALKGRKVYIPQVFTPESEGFFGTTPATVEASFDTDIASEYFDVVTDSVAEGDELSEDDITKLTADDLADVKYAIVKIQNPQDAYGGAEGGMTMMDAINGTEPSSEPVFKPITMQYRPFTADQDYVPKDSLNPEDEYGVDENRSVFGESTYATNESQLDLVIEVKEKLPEDAKLILVVDADHPMCYYEVEPYADAIVTAFGSQSDEAFARIISGEVEPSGLLPYQMPKDMQTVFEQQEDVPRDMDCYTDANDNTYDFCFGLNWSGVIDDDRVATYKVDPLTEPEAEVNTDESVLTA